MKAFNVIWKVVAAIVAIAGIIYVVATYGNRIVAWAKRLLNKTESQFCDEDCDCLCDGNCEECPCQDDCDDCQCGFDDETDDEDFES